MAFSAGHEKKSSLVLFGGDKYVLLPMYHDYHAPGAARLASSVYFPRGQAARFLGSVIKKVFALLINSSSSLV